MNLLHITPYYAPAYAFGGVPRAVEGIARALARRGHMLTVLTTDALSPTERSREPTDTVRDGVRVIRVPNLLARGGLNLSTPIGMRRIVRELIGGVDVIHCHEFRTIENLIVTPAAARAGVPLVLSPHGTLTYQTGRSAVKSAWDRLFSTATARRFDVVIALTNQERDETRSFWEKFGISNRKIEVIPNGIHPAEFEHLIGGDAFRRRYGLGDAPVLLFMGRLHARKGVDVLVEAFKRANVGGARLVIAGPDEGMLPALEPLLDDRIVITGYLAGADRLAALAAADAFALPATGEGLSMAALEALAAGIPAILSPGCNLPEAGESGAALIVEPQVAPMADAIRALMTDPARRELMGTRGRELVPSRFTWDVVAEQLEKVYGSFKRSAEY